MNAAKAGPPEKVLTFWLARTPCGELPSSHDMPSNNQGAATLFPEHMGAPAICRMQYRMSTMQHLGSATRILQGGKR